MSRISTYGCHKALNAVRMLSVMSMLTLLVASCEMKSIVEEPDYVTPYMMSFFVNTGSVGIPSSSGSRAEQPSGDGYVDGIGLENSIDPDDIHVYLFDADSRLLAWVTDPHMAAAREFSIARVSSQDDDQTFYSVRFRIDRILPDVRYSPQSFKIMVLANWRGYPESGHLNQGVTTITDITSGKDYAEGGNPAIGVFDDAYPTFIPFFGVQEYSDVTFHPGENEQSQLLLLRAFAKIDVCDAPNSLMPVKKVVLHRYNGSFFKAPLGIDSSRDYAFAGSQGNVYVSTLSLPDDPCGWEKDKEVVLNAGADDDGHFVAFVPEYMNVGRPDEESRCWLEAEYEDGRKFRIDFKYYSDPLDGASVGDPFDIRRNYWYQFELNRRDVSIDINVDVQPFTEHKVRFDFGLKRDDRGDLMVLPIPKRDENGNTVMTYPKYFLDFIQDDNPKHKYPKEENEKGEPTTGLDIKLTDGDYYAIVVGEDEEMSNAVIWVKDRTGCRVLSNFGSEDSHSQECKARLVESFFGNNQSEKFYKDIFGFRRVYHFENHNSIVIDPDKNNLLFCMIENFQQENQTRKYYEVESWDESSLTGWIINKDDKGNELGFQKITSDGLLGETVGLDGKPLSTND